MNSLDRSGKIRILAFSVLIISLSVLFGKIPLFWDMSYISEVASHILDARFSQIIFPEFDNGTPPLYSLYLAFAWLVFGKSLIVAHLAAIPLVIVILWQFQKILDRFAEKRFHTLAFILLIAEPCFITQSILAGYDLAICGLFLLGLNSILSKKIKWKYVAFIFLPLLSSRAFSYVFALFVIEIIVEWRNLKFKNFISLLLPYFVSAAVFCSWNFYHHSETSWFFVSAGRENLQETGDFFWLIRNFVFIVWKIVDSGRILLFLLIALLFANAYIKKSKEIKEFRMFALILCTPIATYIVFFLPFHFPVAQRYFLIVYILAIAGLFMLLKTQTRKNSTIIWLIVLISLLGGNYWLYPERYGNAWDSSLKVLPYFKIENEMHDYVVKEKIDPSTIAVQFPMNFNRKYTYLEEQTFAYTDIDSKPLSKHSLVILSNISNSISPSYREELNKKWVLLKQFQSGMVYIKLFKNPASTGTNL
jgi:hypothetical protein